MVFPRDAEMRRVVIARPTHRCRTCILLLAIRSSNIVEVQVLVGGLRTRTITSVMPERERSVDWKNAWQLSVLLTRFEPFSAAAQCQAAVWQRYKQNPSQNADLGCPCSCISNWEGPDPMLWLSG